VNDEDIRYLQKEQTPVSPGDTISIIPSVAGGVQTTEDARSVRLHADSATLPNLTNDEFKRYSRHLIMPEVGVDGQRKLKAAKVLCRGSGGLAARVAMSVAAAAVGTRGLADFDVSDYTSVPPQFLPGRPDLRRSRLATAS